VHQNEQGEDQTRAIDASEQTQQRERGGKRNLACEIMWITANPHKDLR
jgi:hypothetical protein